MTALTLPTRLEQDAHLRPVPWHRMGWVIWRHHRVALAGVVVFLGALSVWLWIAGLSLHHAYALAIACHPSNSTACSNLIIEFETTNTFLKGGFVLQPIPALIGAFVGPIVLAREFETGTFRYAWTQGFGRWRWAAAKLVVLGIVVATVAGAFSMLLSWYYQPYLSTPNPDLISGASPLSPGLFDLRGVSFAAWTLLAFAIGVLAGMLIRRIVPAIVATLAAYAAFALLAANVLREHYLAASVAINTNIPGSAWITSQWWTKAGRTVFGSRIPLGLLPQLCPSSFVSSSGGRGISSSSGALSPTSCLLRHGYTELSDYQPVSHFWPMQWIEGGWLLALSTLLVVVTVLLVRRRAA